MNFSWFTGYCLCALYCFGALCCLARSLLSCSFFVLRHWCVSQVFTLRTSQNSTPWGTGCITRDSLVNVKLQVALNSQRFQ